MNSPMEHDLMMPTALVILAVSMDRFMIHPYCKKATLGVVGRLHGITGRRQVRKATTPPEAFGSHEPRTLRSRQAILQQPALLAATVGMPEDRGRSGGDHR